MSSVYADYGRLRVGFMFNGRYRSEPLHLDDNRANRRAAEDLARRLQAFIIAGSFGPEAYTALFPNGKNCSRLFGIASSPTHSITQVPTLAEFAEIWLHERRAHIARSTWAGYASQIRSHLIPAAIAKLPINCIDDGHVHVFVAELCDRGIDAGLVNKVICRLRGIFKTATARRIGKEPLVEVDPMPRVGNLRTDTPEADPFSAEEVRALLDATQGWERTLLFVLLYTGLRPNEALALRWSDIDLKRRHILVRRGLSRRVEGHLKTRSSKRTVDIAPDLAVELSRQRQRTGFAGDGEGLVFPGDQGFSGEVVRMSFTRRHPKTGEAVQVREHRQAMNRAPSGRSTSIDLNNFRRRNWKRILRAAGVRPRNIYQCRHTFAVLMIERGESPLYVADQLGHVDLTMVNKTYARWSRKPQPLLPGGLSETLVTQGVLKKLI